MKKNIEMFCYNFIIMRVNLTRRSSKSELIDGIVFPWDYLVGVVKLTPPIQRTRQLNYALITQRVHFCVAHRSLQCRLIARSLHR